MPAKRSNTPSLKGGKVVSSSSGKPAPAVVKQLSPVERRDVVPLPPLFCQFNHPLVVARTIPEWPYKEHYQNNLACGNKNCPDYMSVVLCGEPAVVCEYHRSNKKVNKEGFCWCGEQYVEMGGEGEQTLESSMLNAVTLGCPKGHGWKKVFLEGPA